MVLIPSKKSQVQPLASPVKAAQVVGVRKDFFSTRDPGKLLLIR